MRRMIAIVVVALFATPAFGEESPARARHLIYLHGRIVQDQQNPRPRHERYGHYEMKEIVEALRRNGLVVTAEIRPKSISVDEAADRTVEQVRRLLESGVPADHVTVLGASMGAAIALRTAVRLKEPDVRFILLSPCLSANVPAVAKEEGAYPVGHVLAVREESDIPSTDCSPWSSDESPPGLHAQEIVVNTGLGHGFLYRPLDSWLLPAVQWALKGSLAER